MKTAAQSGRNAIGCMAFPPPAALAAAHGEMQTHLGPLRSGLCARDQKSDLPKRAKP